MTRIVRRYARIVRRSVYTVLGMDLAARREVALPVLWLGSEYGSFGVWGEPLGPDSVVYSAGVGEDISFDIELIAAYGVQVEAFDPTPHSVAWVEEQELSTAFRFTPVGVAGADGDAKFFLPENPEVEMSAAIGGHATTGKETAWLPVRRIGTLMAERGHTYIDVLKMDIEGAEYDVIEDVLASELDIGQVLVEVHHFLGTMSERRALTERTRRLRSQMYAAGYRLFAVSDLGHDYSFVHTDLLTRHRSRGRRVSARRV
ncbi:MAG: FkbM family methyltransferase [Bacteroidota bacterium]